MTATNDGAGLNTVALSLPKGGGAIRGMGGSQGPIGPSGTASLSLALPVSPGRGYAPSLGLSYSSAGGNGVFGIGWQVPVMMISRRTSHGVPRYTQEDVFVGPDGDVLVPEVDENGGAVVKTNVSTYGGVAVGGTYSVTRYLPRVEGGFDLIEYWQPIDNISTDFWLVHGADGQLHLLGKTSAGRLADPASPAVRTACWLIEESVSPTGEHIGYQYVSETDLSLAAEAYNVDAHDSSATRYLGTVCYGNKTPSDSLFLWSSDNGLTAQDWLFNLVFDYGSRGTAPMTAPGFMPSGSDVLRDDAFSHYAFGFEVRTRGLCQQVLMFHTFTDELGPDPVLVNRLLFEYETDPVMSRLVAAHSLAYEIDGSVLTLPPIEWAYSAVPSPQALAKHEWQVFPAQMGLDDSGGFQLVDLYGEGVPGILGLYNNAWYYWAAIRDQASGSPDGVTYAEGQLLTSIPTGGSSTAILTDINGDGQLDWLETQPGMAGFFTLRPDGSWSTYIPLKAIPTEFFHPQAQMADVVGAGLSDLVLIGPKSVRLYANKRSLGFERATEVQQDAGISLPNQGRDSTKLVAFSDVLGSGQSHLVSVHYDRVVCWPNLGWGRFGSPLTFPLSGLDQVSFNPERLYLADLDGSGAADLIYADRDKLVVYFNLSGNGFARAPLLLPYPEGRGFDQLSAINFADVGGRGMTDIVLSVPYSGEFQAPQHWHYSLSAHKPYLLNRTDNNIGAVSQIIYRSSAQEWLDEKQECIAADKQPVCALPFPVHVVSRLHNEDQLTGNQLIQSCRYRKGVYDGLEREFRGFGYVETLDSPIDPAAINTKGSGTEAFSPPLRTCSWYHTGREEDESMASMYSRQGAEALPYVNDDLAFSLPATVFSQFSLSAGDTVFEPDKATRWWLYRSLKGSLLRSEMYGLDGTDVANIPYSVSTACYQVRQVQVGSSPTPGDHVSTLRAPVALPTTASQLNYSYERIATDPLITQNMILAQDQYGAACRSCAISYPRRSLQSNPYPSLKPETIWQDTQDDQQQVLRLVEQRQSYYHLDTDISTWRLSLPYQSRTVHWAFDTSVSNDYHQGLSPADLLGTDGLLSQVDSSVLGGQGVVYYQGANAPAPDFVALVDYQESAQLDADSLTAYSEVLRPDELNVMLGAAGYQLCDQVLTESGESSEQIWCVWSGFTTYGDSSQFYRPLTQWNTSLTAPGTTATWDENYCAVISTADALGNTVTAEYDYRFVQPWRLIDSNANIQEVQFDGFGRVLASTTYGTELPAGPVVNTDSDLTVLTTPVGFDQLSSTPVTGWESWPSSPRAAMLSVDEAISQVLSGQALPQRQAVVVAFAPFSWMGLLPVGVVDAATWQMLVTQRYLTAEGYLRTRAWQAYAQSDDALPEAVKSFMVMQVRVPVHSTMLTADRYPSDPQQQVRINVAYNDGFGRVLQTNGRVPSGEAWQRLENGELAIAEDGSLLSTQTNFRWAVSGRVEYDNKGQPVRVYQPYFMGSWQYVNDLSARTEGYADSHYYDALGREVLVITALGWRREVWSGPWFSVAWDENDTWQSVLQQKEAPV
ncbi:Toxin subunit YenB [Pseudomonas chlororaphis]